MYRPLLVRFSFILVFLSGVVAPSWAALDEVSLYIGVYTSSTNTANNRVVLDDTRYSLEQKALPLNLERVRQMDVFYIDQFPEGRELFRNDREAFQKMLFDGGVLLLMGDPSANEATINAYNYIGTRLGFQFTSNVVEGDMIPVTVGEGPLKGNVWACERGVRALNLDTDDNRDWRVHFKSASGNFPALASLRVGRGLIILCGTNDINPARGESPLTLVHWARKYQSSGRTIGISPDVIQSAANPSGENSGDAAPVIATGWSKADPITPTSVDVERVMASSSTNDLSSRLQTVRALYSGGRKTDSALSRRSVLLPSSQRVFFPQFINTQDIDSRPAGPQEFRGNAVLIVFWASWSPKSREVIAEFKEYLPELQATGLDVIGVSLDQSVDTVRTTVAELGLTDWTIICDQQSYNSPIVEGAGVSQIPATIILDRQGRVASRNLPTTLMERALREAMTE